MHAPRATVFEPPPRGSGFCFLNKLRFAVQCSDPAIARRGLLFAFNASAITSKISDFGMAVKLQQHCSHKSNHSTGTPFYAAPDAALSRQMRRSSDVYSFGVIMWELIMGCSVFVYRCALSLLGGIMCATTETRRYHPGAYHGLLCARAPLLRYVRKSLALRCRGNQGTALRPVHFSPNPLFPHIPDAVPRRYASTVGACLSGAEADRPPFGVVLHQLAAMRDEVFSGSYRSAGGALLVRSPFLLER